MKGEKFIHQIPGLGRAEIDVTHIKYLGLLRDFLDSIEERMVQPDETKL